MKFPLRLKFLLTYILFAAAAFLVIMFYSTSGFYKNMAAQKGRELYSAATQLADTAAAFTKSDLSDENALARLALNGGYLDADIWLTNTYGYILYDSTGSHTGKTISDFQPALTDKYITGTFHNMYLEDMITSLAPISSNYKVVGYIIISTPLNDVYQNADTYLNIFYITLGMILACSLLFWLFYEFFIARQIRKITRAAKSYADGKLNEKIDVKSNDELGYLAGTLNYMSQQMSQNGDYEKQFISNVSHDFRSPLTSIKGYLEAMLDGTIPPQMQEKYLRLVIAETDRLTNLSKSLLTLNTLADKNTRLNISTYDVNAQIRQVCASFEGQCSKKDISFELQFGAADQPVVADYDKINQVLYNLIDNAIKFSPQSSVIQIEAYQENEKVFVSVRDHGCGIPKDSLPLIWKRFYKVDNSRGRDKKGSGLGLSIVREIVHAHEQHIDVVSTEGAGTTFTFTLARPEKVKPGGRVPRFPSDKNQGDGFLGF